MCGYLAKVANTDASIRKNNSRTFNLRLNGAIRRTTAFMRLTANIRARILAVP